MKNITCADWHIRGTVPSCVDATPKEWMDIQKQALDKTLDIAIKNEVSNIFVGGDLFHSENATTFECIFLIQDFARRCHENGITLWIMAGNHDLPYHSSENINKSAIGILLNSEYIKDMSECPFVKGCNFDKEDYGEAKKIFKHVLTIPSYEKPDFIECETPETLLEKYPHAKMIFTGDYHKNFVHEDNGRFVINSGCLTKQAIDFKDYTTGVYLVDFENDDVTWCPINIEQKFNEDREIKKEKDEMLEQFVMGISHQEVTLDFISSLKNEANKHGEDVKEKINTWIKDIGQ